MNTSQRADQSMSPMRFQRSITHLASPQEPSPQPSSAKKSFEMDKVVGYNTPERTARAMEAQKTPDNRSHHPPSWDTITWAPKKPFCHRPLARPGHFPSPLHV